MSEKLTFCMGRTVDIFGELRDVPILPSNINSSDDIVRVTEEMVGYLRRKEHYKGDLQRLHSMLSSPYFTSEKCTTAVKKILCDLQDEYEQFKNSKEFV